MKIILTSICIFLITPFAICQMAVIKDPDGWTNIRNKPSETAKILGRIYEAQVFWYDPEIIPQDTQWMVVYSPESFYCSNGYNEIWDSGYIHVSRLLPLNNLEEYTGNDFSFKYFISNFDSVGKKITYANGEMPIAINGKHMWGTDGTLPYSQVVSISISMLNHRIPIKKELYEDLFNINDNLMVFKIKDHYIVSHWNSDGAGSYQIAWVINQHGVKQRLVGIFY